MMNALYGGLRSSIRKWLVNAKKSKFDANVNKLKQENCIDILNRSINGKKSDLIKISIKNLHKNMRIKQISKAFFNKLLDTQSGMVMRAIQVWNSLPDKDANKTKQNVLKLFNKLLELVTKDTRYTYSQFKN